MKQKILCLAIVALFVLSTLPMALASDDLAMSPVKVTQEIDAENTPFLSDSIQINYAKPSASDPGNSMIARARPPKEPKYYSLTIEIDYIEGHYPTETMLNYMKDYYAQENIILTIDIDNKIDMSESYKNGISDAEFWAIELDNNDGDDKATSPNDGKYTLPEKWVLYGTSVEGEASIVGYTYCVGTSRDLIAGNYIYIADGATDAWAISKGIDPAGAEAVVLMHEFGHSIGICVVRVGTEVYCSDYYCVMSYLRTQNAGNLYKWYYCRTHWKTKNLEYYVL